MKLKIDYNVSMVYIYLTIYLSDYGSNYLSIYLSIGTVWESKYQLQLYKKKLEEGIYLSMYLSIQL
jgi:hypothetical protein